jgi:ABC-type polysaccharide/polyol phosphate export permease
MNIHLVRSATRCSHDDEIECFVFVTVGILMVIFFSASIYHANTVLVTQAALKVGEKNIDEWNERESF